MLKPLVKNLPVESEVRGGEMTLQPAQDSSYASNGDMGAFAQMRSLGIVGILQRFPVGTLTGKASLNAVATFLDYGARLLVSFFVNPLLVRGLGNYLYGTWQILGRMIGYISAASGRPTQALKMTIANQQSSEDYEKKRRQVGSAVAVWVLFSPVLIAAGGVLVWMVPSWLHIPAESIMSVRIATALLVMNLVMMNFTGVPESVLHGENMGYKRMGLSAGILVLGGMFMAAAMYFETGIVGAALARTASLILSGIFFLQVVRMCVSWFGIAMPSFEEVRNFICLNGWFLSSRLINQFMLVSDVIVLGMLGSVPSVTTYTLTKYAPESLISAVAIAAGGVLPGLGGFVGSGHYAKVARIRGELMAITWLIATGVGSTILIWNRDFVGLWVGAAHFAGTLSTTLIMLMTLQLALIRIDANIIDVTLNLRWKVLIGALSTALSLLAAGFLVGWFHAGIVGLCLGFVAGRLILSLGYPFIINRFLGLSPVSQITGCIRPAAVMILLFAVSLVAGRYLHVASWFNLVIWVSMTWAVASVVAFRTGLPPQQRLFLWRRARSVLIPM